MLSLWSTVLLAAGTCISSPTLSFPRTTSSPVVTVKNGSYTGLRNPTYSQDFFLGIPFAQPPVNDLRFRNPVSLNSSWPDSRAATAYPPFCVGYGGDDTGHDLAEDCLYLNVIRPSDTTASSELPVAVWIHGGGLFMGGTNDPRYNLSFVVQNSVDMGTPMIGISIQYRLSGWGFLGGKEALEGGATNLGFRDQRLALQWIRENVGAFGGCPDKVTIWGESAGGQSVGSQLLAYNGRDDSLFRGAIAESGGPAVSFFPSTLVGGYNSTAYQTTYNTLVSNTSCASTLSSGNSLACLRTLPFAELNSALNSTSGNELGPFVPIIDGDFIATYPSVQLAKGDFVKVPLLIGTNTDEGTAFAPASPINTTTEFLSLLNATFASPDAATASTIAALYPDIPAIGIPDFSTYPYAPNSSLALALGKQYRRKTSFFGDLTVNSARRASNVAWSSYGVPSYSYRFNVVVNGVPNYIGATHFQEVAFMFNNTRGEGYAVDPFANLTSTQSAGFQSLATFMSRSWVSFVVDGTPAKSRVAGAPTWPNYDIVTGGGVGKNMVFEANGSYVEVDDYREEGMKWIADNALSLYGR
ncbi:Alpha/Beta hydrolase protein [Halenospora varia]|nr:Alpha/Beta hydrolase protein [Halenospora varia]